MNWFSEIPFFDAYLSELQSFQFKFDNPLLWALLLLLYFIARRSWLPRKSLSFTTIIGGVLLLTTFFEGYLVDFFQKAGWLFEPIIVRLLSCTILMIIVLYYYFIRTD